MKLKERTDLTKYNFKQWPSGVWYHECELLDHNEQDGDFGSEMSFYVEDNELKILHNNEQFSTDNKWLTSVFDIPKDVIKLIKEASNETR